MGRTARCAAAALAAVVAGGALGLAADARAVDGPYDYVAVSFLLLASALVVGGVVVLLVALADRLLGRLPAEGSSAPSTAAPADRLAPALSPTSSPPPPTVVTPAQEAVPGSASPVTTSVVPARTAAASVGGPASLSAARTAAHRHAATARRAAGAATRRAGQHASTAQRAATTSVAAAVARSVAVVRSTTLGRDATARSTAAGSGVPDVVSAPAAARDEAVPVGTAVTPGDIEPVAPRR